MSAVSVAFHTAFAEHVMPVLASIGFVPSKASHVRPGLVADVASRPLDANRRLEATAWCGPDGTQLRFRFDVVESIGGVECHREVALPWQDGNLAGSVDELRPQESIERLQLSIAFIAGVLATSATRLADAVTEIAADVRRAATSPIWRSCADGAVNAWENRHRRGEIEHDPVPGKLVFNGDELVYIEAGGRRLMFRVPGRELDTRAPIIVSDWHQTAARTRVATRLTNGSRTWVFDLRGSLVTTAPACSP